MSTWLAEHFLDLVGTLADAYYAHKYGALSRRLGRPDAHPDPRRGFIIIQIDGLSYDHLLQAIEAGCMPHVNRLLATGRMKAAPWRSGLPSTTPAVQAGIMFGNRFDIPGFRWYEKDRGRGMSAKLPDAVRAMRARVSAGRPGILRGGSCYVSMFDGDADLALFTLSTLHRQRFFESMRGIGWLLLFLLNPFRVLRVIWLAAAGYLSRLWRRLIALVRPSVVKPFDLLTPLVQVLSETLFSEVQTFGVLLDIYRCAPAIYANYTTYDNIVHKAGLDHKSSLRALREVDARIHQIDRMRARYRRREYDLYILSDHGNSPAIPFTWVSGTSLTRHIAVQVGEDLSEGHPVEAQAHSTDKARYLAEELVSVGLRFPRLRPILRAFRHYAGRRLPEEAVLDYDMDHQRDVIVSASGPLAHVYFKLSARPLDLIDVLLLYPHLLDTLLATPGVGALVGRAGTRTVVLGAGGGMLVVESGREVVERPHPLTPFGDVDYATAQLHQLAHFPHAGDLIVLGAVRPDGKVVGFEEQIATHGGLGGTQMRPFIIRPAECPLVPEDLDDAIDLYPYFTRLYVEQSLVGRSVFDTTWPVPSASSQIPGKGPGVGTAIR